MPEPEFVDGFELSQRLAAALRNANDVRLAVAFWGNGAAEALGICPVLGARFRVVCNLMSGGTNPHEVRTLLRRGVDVRQLNDLHAKLGVTDDLSFLGSSNMSTNGLGDDGTGAGWREANIVYPNARPEIAKMFDDFWRNASPINDTDLNNADVAWAARRRGNAIVTAGAKERSLVDVLRMEPEQLDALNVRMVVYDTMTDEEELVILSRAEEEARRRYGNAFAVYWDWESMTTEASDAYLVDYDWPARGRIARGALYRRDTGNFADFEEEGETFHAAFQIDTIEGIIFGAADRAAIRDAFHGYVRDGHAGEDADQRIYNFPISELAPYLQPIR